VGYEVKAFNDLDDAGAGVQNLEKPDVVILERSLTLSTKLILLDLFLQEK